MTTIRLNTTHMQYFRKYGLSMTKICRRAMSDAVNREGDEFIAYHRISELEDSIEELSVDISKYKTKIRRMEKRKEDKKAEIKRLHEQNEIIRRNNDLSRLMISFNKAAESYGFEVDEVENGCADILIEIRKTMKDFDIDTHLARIRKWR